MIFSGKNYRTTPKTKSLSFSFENVFLSDAGSASIGFSGENNVLKFTFSNNKIYDFHNNYVFSYDVGSTISISGDISDVNYRYFINGNAFVDGKSKNNFKIEKLITDSTGCNLNADVSLACRDIDYSFFTQSIVRPSGNFIGHLKNNSSTEFKVFNFSYRTDSIAEQNPFTGIISGDVPAKGQLNFNLSETLGNGLGPNYALTFELNTNIGLLSFPVRVDRIDHLGSDIYFLSLLETRKEFPFFLGASGENSFVFSGQSGNIISSLQYSAYDKNVNLIDKSVTISLDPHYPAQSGVYTGDYLTGISVIRAGYYNKPPFPDFNSYHSLTGFSFNENNLFMPDCPSVMPFLFSGDGNLPTGSGNFYLRTLRVGLPSYDPYININGDNGNTGNVWKQITGYSIVNNASGFENKIEFDILSIDAGDFGGYTTGCFDVPSVLGFNHYIFSGANIQTQKTPIADYAYGYSIVTGGSGGSGAGVKSVVITNPGSGYNSFYVPRVNFIRAENDGSTEVYAYTGNKALANVLMNNGGKTFNFYNTWDISTGDFSDSLVSFKQSGLTGVSGYYSSGNLAASQTSLFLKVDYVSIDKQNESVVSLRISGAGGLNESIYITGSVMYSMDTGFLITPIKDQIEQVLNARFLIDAEIAESDPEEY